MVFSGAFVTVAILPIECFLVIICVSFAVQGCFCGGCEIAIVKWSIAMQYYCLVVEWFIC